MISYINLLIIYLLTVSSVESDILSEKSVDFEIDLSPNVCSLDSECLDKDSYLKNAFDYLKQYGYLPIEKTWDQITTIELSNAFTRLQEFSGLPITGYLDQNLIDILKTSRCSEPDFRQNELKSKRRHKRSTVGSYKWLPNPNQEMRLNWFIVDDTSGDAIQKGADIWMKVANISLRQLNDLNESYYYNVMFETDPNSTENLILTRFARSTEFKVAQNFQYYSFNVTFRTLTNIPPEKVLAIMVHMWGHILGLEHTKNSNSIMWPFFLNKSDPNPSGEDIADIQILYGSNPNASDSEIMVGLNPKFPDLSETAPNLCLDSKIDSILELSDGVWVMFKDKHYFRIGPFGPKRESPRRIVWDFKNFSSDSVDASLSWDNVVFLFSGTNYWKYINNQFIVSRKISDGFKGIPDGPFDDVFKWNVNQKIYFFKEGQYWKYDSTTKSVSNGFPKKISDNWKGIPDKFDAAISSRTRNQTYFFVGKKYYRFDDIKKQVVNSSPPYPRETEIWFVKCRNTLNLPPKQTVERFYPEYRGVADNDLDLDYTVIDNNSYWEGVLITELLLSIVASVTFGVLSAYLYFVVLKSSEGQQQQQPPQPMQPLQTRQTNIEENKTVQAIQPIGQQSGSSTPSEQRSAEKPRDPKSVPLTQLRHIDSGSEGSEASDKTVRIKLK